MARNIGDIYDSLTNLIPLVDDAGFKKGKARSNGLNCVIKRRHDAQAGGYRVSPFSEVDNETCMLLHSDQVCAFRNAAPADISEDSGASASRSCTSH